MSYTVQSFTAGGTILIGRAVMVDTSADYRVVQATANASCLGIASLAGRAAPIPELTTDPPEAAQEGETLDVLTSGQGYCVSGASFANGAFLKATTGGKLIAITESAGGKERVIARAIDTAGGADEIVKVEIVKFTETTETA